MDLGERKHQARPQEAPEKEVSFRGVGAAGGGSKTFAGAPFRGTRTPWPGCGGGEPLSRG